MPAVRSFAIVPAAGLSQRMGQHKLLLPWRDETVMDNCLRAWTSSSVTRAIVVVRARDQLLIQVCHRYDVDLVLPDDDPPDMKQSARLGLTHARDRYSPSESDVWMMAPADIPGLTPHLIDRVLAAHQPDRPSVLVPIHLGRRGHPTLFPWRTADEVFALSADQGIDTIVRRSETRQIELDTPTILADLDTMDDYLRLLDRP